METLKQLTRHFLARGRPSQHAFLFHDSQLSIPTIFSLYIFIIFLILMTSFSQYTESLCVDCMHFNTNCANDCVSPSTHFPRALINICVIKCTGIRIYLLFCLSTISPPVLNGWLKMSNAFLLNSLKSF